MNLLQTTAKVPYGYCTKDLSFSEVATCDKPRPTELNSTHLNGNKTTHFSVILFSFIAIQ
jgi:hypothetical protein